MESDRFPDIDVDERSEGIKITHNHPLMILYRLNGRLSFGTLKGEEDQIAKARKILEDEIELNGVPTDERAYHLLIVGGIRVIEQDDYHSLNVSGSGIDPRNGGIVIDSAQFEPKKYKVIGERKMGRNSALQMLSMMAAFGGLGSGFSSRRSFSQGGGSPAKEQMPLTEEETLKLSELNGKEKKAFIKELKTKYVTV